MTRVDSTSAKSAQWLLDFYESNFPETRAEERKRWCVEWGLFTGRLGPSSLRDTKVPDGHMVDHAWRELRRKLQSLREGKVWVERLGAKVSICLTEGEIVARVEYETDTEANAHNVEAVKVLAKAAEMLRACGNPKCERFFLRSKRQQYCSTRCRDTVNKRVYRKRLRIQKKK